MLKSIVSTFQTVMGSSLSQQSAIETISQWRSKPSRELIFDSGRREISQYMQAVDQLQKSGSNGKLISTAMDRLRAEFDAVLSRQADHQAGPISTTCSSISDSTAYAFRYEEYTISEPPSNDVITYLRNIAERMNASGKIGECVKAYKSVRKSSLQSQLKRLRFDELIGGYSKNNARRYMPDELKVKMELWIQVSKICVRKLFEREKTLCNEIFQNLGNGVVKDECFVGTVKDFAVGLFGFAEAISLSKQPYDKMGSVLGVYNAFSWVLPSANSLFESENGKGIRDSIGLTLSRIEDDVGRMMYDLQDAIVKEISDACDERGGVHRSTEHVMEQINVIVSNKELLTRLIKSSPSLDFGDLWGDYSHNRTFLELHLILIFEVLLKNLEMKCTRYQEPSLAQVFMMNNVCYILRKIEGSNELKQMIGDQYLAKLKSYLHSARTNYQTSTCNKFLSCFQEKGLYINGCFKSRPSKKAIKKRLSEFNTMFEEIRVVHSLWRVVDLQLRDEVRVSMSAILVPAYKNFLENFRTNPETKPILERNAMHSPEELEALVLEQLFADDDV